MAIILFIIVLAVLIFVHELGHFLAAKSSKIRVDEFGIGYPPRAASFKPKNSETTYSLNWIPFGGFVKIFGEDPNEESISGPESDRSMVNKSKLTQVGVLAAGVFFNVVFAWLLLSFGLMSGLPAGVSSRYADSVEDANLVITSVMADSPAEATGIKAGDRINAIYSGDMVLADPSVHEFQVAVSSLGGQELRLEYTRSGEVGEYIVIPEDGILKGAPAIGVSLDMVGTLKLPPHRALYEGVILTKDLVKTISVGLGTLVADAVRGDADFAVVAGPVGIISLVGDASELGFVYLLSFTAFISINLAIINLVPFPALDGGRILFVIIEAIKGSRINPKIANGLNLVGFGILILLMVLVTFNDIIRLVL